MYKILVKVIINILIYIFNMVEYYDIRKFLLINIIVDIEFEFEMMF